MTARHRQLNTTLGAGNPSVFEAKPSFVHQGELMGPDPAVSASRSWEKGSALAKRRRDDIDGFTKTLHYALGAHNIAHVKHPLAIRQGR